MKQSIIALVICTVKIFIIGNSAKETFSNFWKQQLANLLAIFDYLLYKQVDRIAMGSPLGPTLANAF